MFEYLCPSELFNFYLKWPLTDPLITVLGIITVGISQLLLAASAPILICPK